MNRSISICHIVIHINTHNIYKQPANYRFVQYNMSSIICPVQYVRYNMPGTRGGGTGGGGTGGTCPPPPHFSPQSMKCPTSTGVHARPTMYQEGVPRGAIKNRKTWGIAPRAINPGGTIKLLHYRAGFFRSLY